MKDLLNGALRPVSNEEMERILNEESSVLTSGSGSGSGSGCGSGSGSGSGSGCGSGSGSGDDDEYIKTETYTIKAGRSSTAIYGAGYEFSTSYSISCDAYADKYGKYGMWSIHIVSTSFSFSIGGKRTSAGKDENGNDIIYATSGGETYSRTLPGGVTYDSCTIKCSTDSPKFQRLIACMSGSISLDVSSSGEVKESSSSFNCNIIEA